MPTTPLTEVSFQALVYIGQPAADDLLDGLREADGIQFLRLCGLLVRLEQLPLLDDSLLKKACVQMALQQVHETALIGDFLLKTQTDHDRLSSAACQLYSSEFASARRACLKILSSSEPSQESKAIFSEAIGDTDPTVRRWAILALRKLSQSEPHEATLQLLQKCLNDSDSQVIDIALITLMDANALNRINEETLIRIAVSEAETGSDTFTHALKALEAKGESAKEAIPRLLPMLEGAKLSNARNRSDRVIETLAAIGTAAIDPLVSAANDLAFSGRVGAVRSLGLIGPAAIRAVPSLESLLTDEDSNVAVAAALALASIEGPKATKAIPVLIKQCQQIGTPGSTAGDALVLIGEPVLDDLEKELTENSKSQMAICRVLYQMGSPSVPILIDAISKRKGGLNAIEALGMMGPDAAPSVPLLITQLNGQYSRVVAADALGRIGPNGAGCRRTASRRN